MKTAPRINIYQMSSPNDFTGKYKAKRFRSKTKFLSNETLHDMILIWAFIPEAFSKLIRQHSRMKLFKDI